MNPRSAPAQRDSEAALNALLERHRAGDGSALNSIMVEIYPLVHRFVYRLVGVRRQDLHEDLVQSSLEQLCTAIDGFEGRSRVTTFVYGICYRVVARHRRSERIRNLFRSAAEDATLPSGQAPADDQLDRARLVAQAHRELDRLSADERAAFVMHELEDLGLDEVAAAMRCSTRTVKRRLRSARARIVRGIS
jgi:RNA polymerase sigma-70 factor (ECF subfamily)